MITIDALRICDGERTPLDGVTMLLTANAVHGIAGEGRSELLRAVYGLAVPESGSVTSGGHPLRRRDMAYLEAEPRFWPGLTAGDCLGLVRRYHPASDPAPLLRRRGRPRPLRTLRIRSGGPGSGRFGDCGKMSTFTKNSMP